MKALKIKSKMIQLRALLVHEKYLKIQGATIMYVRNKRLYIPTSATTQIFTPSDLYLKANKSFLKAITETGFAFLLNSWIVELRKEMNDDQMDL